MQKFDWVTPPGQHVPGFTSISVGQRVLYCVPMPGKDRRYYVVERNAEGKHIAPPELVGENAVPSPTIQCDFEFMFLPDRKGNGQRQVRLLFCTREADKTPDEGPLRGAHWDLPIYGTP